MWAMAGLSWRLRPTLYLSIIIAAGTLAALSSSRQNHCATSPNGGSEDTRGLNDSIDSNVDSVLPINMVADEALVERSSELLGRSSEHTPRSSELMTRSSEPTERSSERTTRSSEHALQRSSEHIPLTSIQATRISRSPPSERINSTRGGNREGASLQRIRPLLSLWRATSVKTPATLNFAVGCSRQHTEPPSKGVSLRDADHGIGS